MISYSKINHRKERTRLIGVRGGAALLSLLLYASCGGGGDSGDPERPKAAYTPINQLEQSYGRLVTVSNAPTPGQNGTGDRIGLFRDGGGTIWGIPLTIGDDGSVLGCAPPSLRELPVSDTLPADAGEIIGASNTPTGWRGGTGKLELLLRDARGNLRWHPVSDAEIKAGQVCWSQSPPEQPLKHYRLVKAGAS